MHVVVGVDGSDASLTAVDLVTGTAWPVGTRIWLVGGHELPDWTGFAPALSPSDPLGQAQRTLFDRLQDLAEPLRRRGYATETVVARGRGADLLLAKADAVAADLIVVGNRGLGPATSALLGSVSATLVDPAACPVLVARGPRVTRIVVATDGAESSEAIPSVLAAWHLFVDAPIDVISVAPSEHDVERHLAMANQMAARLVATGWHARGAVRAGDPAREIEAAADELGSDLIVTGSRCLGAWERLRLGSVAHHVLLHSHCSVLVMRGHVPARRWRSAEALVAGLDHTAA
jgi:nucleotide-binding universal stress UspA family protein